MPYFPKKMPIVLIAALGTFCARGGIRRHRRAARAANAIGRCVTSPRLGRAAPPPAPTRRAGQRPAAGRAHLPVPRARPPPVCRGAAAVRRLPVRSSTTSPRPCIRRARAAAASPSSAAARNVGTTLTAIALARTLAALPAWCWSIWRSARRTSPSSPNDPSAPGIAELVRGQASFGDIITRDRGLAAHLVSRRPDRRRCRRPAPIADAMRPRSARWRRATTMSCIDAGAQSGIALATVAATAPYAVLVGGDTPANALTAIAGSCNRAGFADVALCPVRRRRSKRPPHNRRHDARRAWQASSTRFFRAALNTLYFSGAYRALRPLIGRRRRDPDAASRAAVAARPVPAQPSARGDAAVLRDRDPSAAPLAKSI